MPAIIGTIGTIVKLNQAVNGNAASNAVYASQIAAGEAAAIAAYNSQLATASNSTLADSLMTNLSLTAAAGVNAASLATLKAAIIQAFEAYPASKGQVIANVGNLLSNLESDATWAPAALAFNNQTAANYSYSVNTSSTTAGSPSSTSSFTLTTGGDNYNGSAGNDAVSAYINTTTATVGQTTLNVTDSLNGGGGTADRLSLTVEGINAVGAYPAATILNFEEFLIRDVNGNGASAYDFAAIAGETLVINDRSTQQVTLTGVAAGTTVQISGNGSVSNGATIFTGASATQAVTLNLVDGVAAGAITRNQTGAAAVTINSTGGATGNNTGVIDLDTATAMTALTINATTRLTTALAADYAATAVVTLNGAALIDLTGSTVTVGTGVITAFGATALSGNILTINAAGNSGGTRSVMGANTVTFTGGSGDDFVSAGALIFSSTGSLAGGTGTDTIVILDAAQLTTTTAAKMTGFELLRLNDDNEGAADTFDTSLLSGLTGIVIGAQSAGDGVVLTNMSAALAGNVTITGTQDVLPTFTITGAGTVGQLDVLNLIISDQLAANNVITLANIGAAGVETINITATDSVTISALTSAAAMTSMAFTATARNVSVTTGALALNTNTAINASLVTGTTTLDATNATANAIALTGGSGVNTLTGTALGDSITGGAAGDGLSGLAGNDTISGLAGNDTITGGAGADTMTGGDGLDTFIFTTLALTQGAGFAAGNTTAANIDRITDFVGNGASAGDSIQITAGSVIATGVTTGAAATPSTVTVTAITVATAADYTALTAGAQAVTGGVASVTGDAGAVQAYDITVTAGAMAGRYLIINDTTAAIAATDTIINLTGITGALNAQDFIFNV